MPVCPEVECGLGTPRESMRLVRVDDDHTAADGQDRRRSDRSDNGIRATPGRAARIRGPVRLRAQEGLAKLRPRTRQGLRQPWNGGEIRTRAVRVPPRRALPLPARRGGRPPVGSPSAGELRRARVCVLEASRAVQCPMDRRGRRPFSHRSQADAAGAFAAGVSTSRPAGGTRAQRAAPKRSSGATRRRSWPRCR